MTWGADTSGAQSGQGQTIPLKKGLSLVLYPYENTTNSGGATTGKIYVVGGGGESYEAACGPVGSTQGAVGGGGHSAGATPSGNFSLADKEHVITVNWPMSTIPWGADLTESDAGIVSYSLNGGPSKQLSGAGGIMTQACGLYYDRTPVDQRKDDDGTPWGDRASTVAKWVQEDLHDNSGNLATPWAQNDFGVWAFNIIMNGQRSPYFVHTTPDDEATESGGGTAVLSNSHGCVHLHPKDRDEMMQKGYLVKGVPFKIMPYGQSGPPS
jgi:hypothetical protein